MPANLNVSWKYRKYYSKNNDYRHVIHTTEHMQLVVMNLKPSENIPKETHHDHDQFIRIEQGNGKAIVRNKEIILNENDFIIIPAGIEHEIINAGPQDLKLYTIYSPPEHPAGIVQEVKPTDGTQHGGQKFFKKIMSYGIKNNNLISKILGDLNK